MASSCFQKEECFLENTTHDENRRNSPLPLAGFSGCGKGCNCQTDIDTVVTLTMTTQLNVNTDRQYFKEKYFYCATKDQDLFRFSEKHTSIIPFSNVIMLVVFSRDSVTNVVVHFWFTRVRSFELI